MGFYFSKKNVSTDEYFVGGRSYSGWVIGLSLVGTSISSISFLAYPGDAYKTAWIRFVPNLMLPFAVLIAAYVFLPFFRKNYITSAYQYLEERFGPGIRVYGAVVNIIIQLIRVSIVLFLVSILLTQLTGLPSWICVVIAGISISIYTVVGGLNAVIWTDVIQTLILVGGGVLCLAVIIYKLPGGFGQIIHTALADGKLAFRDIVNGKPENISWAFTFKFKTITMMLILGFLGWLNEYSSSQSTIQRYCASKSAHEARKAMWFCVFSSLPIWAFFMFLGTSLYVFFKVNPTPEAMQMLDGTRKAEEILPYFVVNYLPPGFVGLVLSAILAAAMSSLDSGINAIATIGVVDIYKRHLVKNKNDKHYLRVAWVFSTVAAIIMIIGAIILAESKMRTLLDAATILLSLVGGGILGIYMLGFFTKKGSQRSVWFGIILTWIFSICVILSKKGILPTVPFDLYYAGLIGNLIMFVVGYLLDLILPGGHSAAHSCENELAVKID